MTGINRVDYKQRRKVRRMNHIAKDLRTPKYRPRVVKPKVKDDYYDDWDEQDFPDYDYFDYDKDE